LQSQHIVQGAPHKLIYNNQSM